VLQPQQQLDSRNIWLQHFASKDKDQNFDRGAGSMKEQQEANSAAIATTRVFLTQLIFPNPRSGWKHKV
jgi:hypothetical protein